VITVAIMCVFFMLGISFHLFWCADSFFCGDGRFCNPDVENSYRVWLVPWTVVLYPVSTVQYPVPRVLTTSVPPYYSTTPCRFCYNFFVVTIMTAPPLFALCISLLSLLSLSLLQLSPELLQSSPSEKKKTAQQRPRQLVNGVDTSHLRGSCALS
jgi:hypothetical protein